MLSPLFVKQLSDDDLVDDNDDQSNVDDNDDGHCVCALIHEDNIVIEEGKRKTRR